MNTPPPSDQSPTTFNPHFNSFNTASKIILALERISEAFRVLLWQESKINGLSPLQNQILIFLAFHPSSQRKVSYLAQEFNMTKPTISDAVRVLVEKNLIAKEQNHQDTRSYALNLTDTGKEIAEKAALFTRTFDTPLSQMAPIEQEFLLGHLLTIIDSFHKEGILTNQRTCTSCQFFSKNMFLPNSFQCAFLRLSLLQSDIRVDCPHHQLKESL